MPILITNQNNNSQFIANDNETILDAALRNNRIYPYGCRNGKCGTCKCQLVSGKVDYGTYNESALTNQEKEEGKVLICQAIPLENLIIHSTEEVSDCRLQIKRLPCRIRTLNRLAKDIIQVFLSLPKSQKFTFLPGQYINILLKDGQHRSFSIANLPENLEKEGLELHIRYVPDGQFTPLLFNSIKERDLMRFTGPFGNYILKSEIEKPILLIAGGTGFSPIKSLLLQITRKNPSQDIHLFWGARDKQDLYMADLIQEWIKKYSNFKYTPVLSESHQSDDWTGSTGCVHKTVYETYKDCSKFDVYTSGPPVMISAIRNALRERKLNLSRFFFDSFEYYHQ